MERPGSMGYNVPNQGPYSSNYMGNASQLHPFDFGQSKGHL